MIDKDKIFQLFVDGKEIKDQKTKDEIKEFMNGPFAKIGMFVKLIQNLLKLNSMFSSINSSFSQTIKFD